MIHFALYKKRCNNNKHCHILLFMFDPDKKEWNIAEVTEKCVNSKPMLLKRIVIKAIKDEVAHMIEVCFTKDNVKLKHLLPVVTEEFNSETNENLELEEET